MSGAPFIAKQLSELMKSRLGGFRIETNDDLFHWTVWFSGPKGSLYYPGQYKAVLTFPHDFPYKPPEFKVLSTIWHPNVYPDGRVCISILHPPGEDEMNSLETASMRWTPVQSIDKVLISIVSLLSDPDPPDAGAPANVDALVEYRKNRAAFEEKCRRNAEKSITELPPNFELPPEEDAPPVESQRTTSLLFDDGEDLDEEPFASELQQIRNMGVGVDRSDEQLLDMLKKYKGDVSVVLERLL